MGSYSALNHLHGMLVQWDCSCTPDLGKSFVTQARLLPRSTLSQVSENISAARQSVANANSQESRTQSKRIAFRN
ncbi:hypothetical protein ACI0FN_00114 [Alcaligenes nematophilus]